MDRELYKKEMHDDLFLRCIGKEGAILVMAGSHEGICGVHKADIKMWWLIIRYGYYC